jgi:hypothetical protein
MSLSPVSAISDMIAPVVLMTLATIFANALMSAGHAERELMIACTGVLGWYARSGREGRLTSL